MKNEPADAAAPSSAGPGRRPTLPSTSAVFGVTLDPVTEGCLQLAQRYQQEKQWRGDGTRLCPSALPLKPPLTMERFVQLAVRVGARQLAQQALNGHRHDDFDDAEMVGADMLGVLA